MHHRVPTIERRNHGATRIGLTPRPPFDRTGTPAAPSAGPRLSARWIRRLRLPTSTSIRYGPPSNEGRGNRSTRRVELRVTRPGSATELAVRPTAVHASYEFAALSPQQLGGTRRGERLAGIKQMGRRFRTTECSPRAVSVSEFRGWERSTASGPIARRAQSVPASLAFGRRLVLGDRAHDRKRRGTSRCSRSSHPSRAAKSICNGNPR